MRSLISLSLLFILLIHALPCQGQNANPKADQLIEEGIELHDQGNYKQALKKYEKAAKIAPKYYLIYSEMSLTYYRMEDYKQSAAKAQQAIKLYDGDSPTVLGNLYSGWANSEDMQGKPEKALEIYLDAMKEIPEDYLLPFNAGITCVRLGRYEEAEQYYHTALFNYPFHPGSHRALGILHMAYNENVKAALAISQFLITERKATGRAVEGIGFLEEIMGGMVEKSGRNNITITLDGTGLSEDSIPDTYQTMQLTLGLHAALVLSGDLDEAFNKALEEETGEKAELFKQPEFPYEYYTEYMEMLVKLANEAENPPNDFVWNYYIPFYKILLAKDLVRVAGALIYAKGNKKQAEGALEYLDTHEAEVDEFVDFMNDWSWPEGD